MPSSLLNLYTMFENKDANSEFRHRCQAAIYEAAINVLEANPASPDNELAWARTVIDNPVTAADRMLPGLLIAANNAGLDLAQLNSVTDAQIRSAVAGLVSTYAA